MGRCTGTLGQPCLALPSTSQPPRCRHATGTPSHACRCMTCWEVSICICQYCTCPGVEGQGLVQCANPAVWDRTGFSNERATSRALFCLLRADNTVEYIIDHSGGSLQAKTPRSKPSLGSQPGMQPAALQRSLHKTVFPACDCARLLCPRPSGLAHQPSACLGCSSPGEHHLPDTPPPPPPESSIVFLAADKLPVLAKALHKARVTCAGVIVRDVAGMDAVSASVPASMPWVVGTNNLAVQQLQGFGRQRGHGLLNTYTDTC